MLVLILVTLLLVDLAVYKYFCGCSVEQMACVTFYGFIACEHFENNSEAVGPLHGYSVLFILDSDVHHLTDWGNAADVGTSSEQ